MNIDLRLFHPMCSRELTHQLTKPTINSYPIICLVFNHLPHLTKTGTQPAMNRGLIVPITSFIDFCTYLLQN